MLKFTPQQMASFSTSSVRSFEERMVRRLSERFPGVDLLARVQQEIERAASFRILSEKDVCRFIELSTVLGEKFDEVLNLPSVTELLGDGAPAGAVQRLHEIAAEHLAGASAGPAAALASGQPGADEDAFSDRTAVGSAVMRCPRVASRRLYSFSS